MINLVILNKGDEMTDLEYVQSKLQSNLFNIKQVAIQSKISRSTLLKIGKGENVKEYIVTALAVFFKNVSN